MEGTKEFFRVYTIHNGPYKLFDYEEICEFICKIKNELGLYYYDLNNIKIQNIKDCGYGYVSEFSCKGRVI